MGGSVAMGADCERRSTTASEEASPKTASRIAERDMVRVIAEIEGVKKRDGSNAYCVGTIVYASDRTRLYLIVPGHCTLADHCSALPLADH